MSVARKTLIFQCFQKYRYLTSAFERPSWKKIVEMIEAGQVVNLIVKDASRLGREYLQVGYYMEILFTHAFVMGLCYYLITAALFVLI